MSEEIRSRELFKSYSRSLDVEGIYHGQPFDPTKAEKAWFDDFLLANPTFVGKREITSPAGVKVVVNYGKNFVEYLYGLQQFEGQITVDRLIISREEAIFFNLIRGDEGTAHADSGIPAYFDFPWDRPLADDEIITKRVHYEGYRIFKESELTTPEEQTTSQLNRIEQKLDEIIALLY